MNRFVKQLKRVSKSRMPYSERILFVPLVLVCLTLAPSVRADTIVLKAGRTYRNVKIVPKKTEQLIVFQTGRLLRVANADVKRVDIVRVRWKRGGLDKTRVDAIVRKAVEKEAERVRRETRAQISKENRVARVARNRAWAEDGYNRLWRSAVLPGWGQYHAGESTRGLLFLAGSTALFANYWSRLRAHGQAQDNFDDRTIPTLMPFFGTTNVIAALTIQQERRRELFKLETSTNRSALLLTAFYGWNLMDAFFFAGKTSRLSVWVGPRTVRFSWRVNL